MDITYRRGTSIVKSLKLLALPHLINKLFN